MADEQKKDSNVKKGKKKVVYYEDNYEESVVLPETEDMPEIKVTYRPLNMLQTSQLTDAVLVGETVAGAAMATMEMLTRHVVSWNIEKPDGQLVNHKDVKELTRLDPGVLQKISRLIRKDKSSPADDIAAVRQELKNLSREQDST
jgi:hypothetical protein